MKKYLIVIFALFCASCGDDESGGNNVSCTVTYSVCAVLYTNGNFTPLHLSQYVSIDPRPSDEVVDKLMPDLTRAVKRHSGVSSFGTTCEWYWLDQQMGFNCADYE